MPVTRPFVVASQLSEERRLLSTVAHEMRTPLATLANATELLRTVVASDPAAVLALAMIGRQTGVLTRLVGDLLDSARVANGQFAVTFELVDLREVLDCAAQACAPALNARGHTFRPAGFAHSLPVMADKGRLVQVFVNLLDNAIKYTPRGGTLSLTSVVALGQVIVRVRDSGVGMPAALLPHVFEFGSQSAATRRVAGGGLGIGLALAHSLVTLHGGTLEANSAGLDQGSELVVRLPLHLRR